MKLPEPEENLKPLGKLPEPEAGLPFLKPADLKNGKGELVIIGNLRRAPEGSFSDLLVDVRIGREQRVWGLRLKSGNYARLYQAFGADPKKWVGKKVKVEVGTHRGKEYVRVL